MSIDRLFQVQAPDLEAPGDSKSTYPVDNEEVMQACMTRSWEIWMHHTWMYRLRYREIAWQGLDDTRGIWEAVYIQPP